MKLFFIILAAAAVATIPTCSMMHSANVVDVTLGVVGVFTFSSMFITCGLLVWFWKGE